MINDFDLALFKKLKAAFSNTISAPIDILYNTAYNLVDEDKTKMSTTYPLVNLYRPSGFSLLENQNFFAGRQGIEFYYNGDTNVSRLARILYARLPYQIDIYAKTFEELSKIETEIMHMLHLDNNLVVHQGDKAIGGLVINELSGTKVTYEQVIADVAIHPERYFSSRYDLIYRSGPDEQSEYQTGDRIYHHVLTYDIPRAMLLDFNSNKNIVEATTELGILYDDDGVVVTETELND